MAERQKVECPECGKVKTSRGSETFRHCGTTHKISENLANHNSGDKLDPEQALGAEQQKEPETQEDKEGEQEQKQETEESEYNCSNCGHGFDRKLLKCPECGKKFDWGALS